MAPPRRVPPDVGTRSRSRAPSRASAGTTWRGHGSPPAPRPPGDESSVPVWRTIATEFGLLPGSAVDAILGPASPPAGCLAAERRILGVATRAGRVLYPGFQFDAAAHRVRPVIADVARLGRTAGYRDRRILAWFCVVSERLGGRPVDRLADPGAVLAAAEADFRWDRRLDPLD